MTIAPVSIYDQFVTTREINGEWTVAIRVARTAGFCMGVRRAMSITLQSAHRLTTGRGDDSGVCTFGPLIHNPQVVALLEKKGIRAVSSAEQVRGDSVIVRAHGIPPETRDELKKAGTALIDATCPRVAKVQAIVKKHAAQGYSVVIIGDPGHAEIVGLLGYANGRGHVVSSADDLKKLADGSAEIDPGRLCVVVQTTQDRARFESLVARIRDKWPECVVFDTICESTQQRQAEVVDLAGQVDLMIIVGGKQSANTRRLTELSASTGTPSYQVETEDDLPVAEIKRAKEVGVTAGASTPNWLIRLVIDTVERIKEESGDVPLLSRLFSKFMYLTTASGVQPALGGAFLTYACCVLQGIPMRWEYPAIASAYIFSIIHLTFLAHRDAAPYNEPARSRFYEKHGGTMSIAGAVSAVAAVVLSGLLGLLPFLMVLFAVCAGAAYTRTIVPSRLFKGFKYRSLKDIPGSKDIFSAGAWAGIAALVPMLASGARFGFASLAAIVFAGTIAFVRSVIFDVRHIQSDQIVGNETIPLIAGKRASKVMLGGLALFLAVFLAVSANYGAIPSVGYYLTACVAYACGYLYLYHERIIFQGVSFEAVVDMNFYVAGAVAALWSAYYG